MMDNRKKLSIFLFTGYTPRAVALKERVEKACNGSARISLIDSEFFILEKRSKAEGSVVILDLPNIKKSAVQTITLVKETVSHTKLLAIHIYTTKLLIDPLIEAGIDGYLSYEPDSAQLKDAITAVLNGDKYMPPEFSG